MPNYIFQQRPQTKDNLEVLTAWLDEILRNPQFGTWTPVITFATPGDLIVVYSTRRGGWRRYGMDIFLDFDLATSTFTHSTATGSLQITGSPFTSTSYGGSTVAGFGVAEWAGITKANFTQSNWRISENSATLNLIQFGSAQAGTLVTATDMPTGGTVRLRGLVIFPTAL